MTPNVTHEGSCYHVCFVTEKPRFKISSQKPAKLTEVFRDFCSVALSKCRDNTLNYATTSSLDILAISFFLSLEM